MASTLVVGTDTYYSAADATTYVGANYATTTAKYIAWAALSEVNKDAYLRQACKRIDFQMLHGRKAVTTQTLEFPRQLRINDVLEDYCSYTYNIIPNDYGWHTETAVADCVKYAQVEEALELCTTGTADRLKLQEQGVKSFSLGDLSEAYTGARDTSTLASIEAKRLLKPYLYGGSVVI